MPVWACKCSRGLFRGKGGVWTFCNFCNIAWIQDFISDLMSYHASFLYQDCCSCSRNKFDAKAFNTA